MWAQHPTLILATIGVIALQSALIAALSVQFFRRRRAEGSLKKSEDRWRSVVESPIFGISFIDRNHRFISTNQTYQRMVGYTNDELRQLTPLAISVPGEREVNDMLFKELREGKRQHFEMVKQLRRKDGNFATGVLHLWHPESDRSYLPDNQRRLDEVTASDRVRALEGLSRLDVTVPTAAARAGGG